MFLFLSKYLILGIQLKKKGDELQQDSLKCYNFFMKLGQRSSWVHWIAVFAILMASLSPVISQAISLNASPTTIDTEICSALGTKISHHIQLDSSKSSDLSSDEHCPYCTLQHVSYIPVAVHTHAFIADQSTIFFSFYVQAPGPLFTWLAQPSRAPPQSLN